MPQKKLDFYPLEFPDPPKPPATQSDPEIVAKNDYLAVLAAEVEA